MWFKILLTVVLALSALASMYEAGKGRYMRQSNPGASLVNALLGSVLAAGMWLWL